MSISSEAKQEVVRLLALGKKIEAVKYIKDTLQVSLVDAKNLVEAVEHESSFGKISPSPFTAPESALHEQPISLSYGDRIEVERLLRLNKKIEAVKFVHDRHKLGLKAALTLVEELEKGIRPLRPDENYRTRKPRRSVDMVAPVMGFVALILVLVMSILYWVNQKVVSQNLYTTGKVVDLDTQGGDGSSPVIEYRWNGKDYRYMSNTRTTPSAYDVGETVGLYIDRENPEEPLIDAFTDRWLAITIVGVIATFFAFFAIVIAKLTRRF